MCIKYAYYTCVYIDRYMYTHMYMHTSILYIYIYIKCLKKRVEYLPIYLEKKKTEK